MNSAFDKGGWMMAMKATRATTFVYTANYWTTTNTLNPSATDTTDGDAKFDSFNYFPAAKIAALWPDIADNVNSGPGGGKIGTGLGGWTWQDVHSTIYLEQMAGNGFMQQIKKVLTQMLDNNQIKAA